MFTARTARWRAARISSTISSKAPSTGDTPKSFEMAFERTVLAFRAGVFFMVAGGYLWSPKCRANGDINPFSEFMRGLRTSPAVGEEHCGAGPLLRALASKVLSMSSVGMCMTMAPGGEREESARGLANCPVIAAALPPENLAETPGNVTCRHYLLTMPAERRPGGPARIDAVATLWLPLRGG